ncbi:MAG TPA: transglycosylase domain-containing protein [Aggregatilineales bacterium]|nr:transglycosylase domain-containing protein [Anaerolineales bacterium]HRE47101.1 transglycosylase domain-containing protein [Aggregatilineales bacterium]
MNQPNTPSRFDDREHQVVPGRTLSSPPPGSTPHPLGMPPPNVDPLLVVYGRTPGTPPPPPPRRRRRNIACLGCASVFLLSVVTMLCGGLIIINTVWNSFNELLTERIATILPETNNTFQTTRIYDRYGNELYQLIDEGRRTKVTLAEIAKVMIDATIAVEDASFYENPGVDVQGIFRAGLGYFTGSEAGGGSTITQQLIRNIAFEYEYRTERSARRKVEEILLALVLTQQKSKDEILEMYLNIIYYGNLAYGAEAAAQTYFGKSAKALTLGEAALIAGLPQSPATLDPFSPDPAVQRAVLNRRRIVLDLMLSRKKIDQAQYTQALGEPLILADPNISLKSPHFTLYAQQELKDLLPAINIPAAYLTTGGLSVYTTLDPNAQELAERVARAQVAGIKVPNNANNAAVVILKAGTGEVLAMLGSVDYKDDTIDGRVNMATAPRQPGSSIKPLTYAAAMERGLSAASVLWDVETRLSSPGAPVYAPVNYDRAFHGPVRIREALARSYNVPAVLTLRQIGVESLLAYAVRVGIKSLGIDSSKYGLALTLGGGEVTPLELASAYAVFANEGNYIAPTSILCVVNNEKIIIYQLNNGCAGRGTLAERSISAGTAPRLVLDPRIAFVISDILADNRARTAAMGANSPLRTDGIITSVKTGTTDDFRDNWTMGYTKNVVVGVWVGNADNAKMRGTTGLTGAAPIWNEVMRGVYADGRILDALKINGGLRPDDLVPPIGVSQRQLCDLGSIVEPTLDCPPGRREWILDTPPLIPDENGNLGAYGVPQFAPTGVPGNGPYLEDIDPGVVKALVRPIDPNLAALIASGGGGVSPYCLVPREVQGQVPDAKLQVFIKPPKFEDEDPAARQYAAGRGLAMLPRLPCTADMLLAAPVYAGAGITAMITSPGAGETVSGTVYVGGTAAWNPGGAAFYKLEIQGPQFPNWTTFAGPVSSPVINGGLGNFGSAGLMPGLYMIRIVVVGNDYNHAAESMPIPINVTGG